MTIEALEKELKNEKLANLPRNWSEKKTIMKNDGGLNLTVEAAALFSPADGSPPG